MADGRGRGREERGGGGCRRAGGYTAGTDAGGYGAKKPRP